MQKNLRKMLLKILCMSVAFIVFEITFATSQEISSYVQKTGQGEIDWTSGYIKVKGTGIAPENMLPAQAKLMARRAAVADAYRNLAEIVEGVQVNAETTVKNYIAKSDVVEIKVSGFIQGARIYDERQLDDGTYEIELLAYLYGNGSLGMIFFEEGIEEETEITKQIEQRTEITTKIQSEVAKIESEKFTGLVIDARGTDVKPCLSPKVEDVTPQLVYDSSYVDKEILLKEGVVTYLKAENEEEQGKINEIMLAMSNGTYSDIPLFCIQDNSYQVASWISKFGKKVEKFIKKVGTNPILVKALTGKDIDLKTIFKEKDYNTLYNLLISKEDREKIERAIKVNNFLKEGKVIIVLGDKEIKLGKAK